MKLRSCYKQATSTPLQPARNPQRIARLALHQSRLYGKPLRYNTGKKLDSETGLYYCGARYVDPKIFRWMSGDREHIKQVKNDFKTIEKTLRMSGNRETMQRLYIRISRRKSDCNQIDKNSSL